MIILEEWEKKEVNFEVSGFEESVIEGIKTRVRVRVRVGVKVRVSVCVEGWS